MATDPNSSADIATEAEAPVGKTRPKPGERRLQILQTIAAMLEEQQPERITTAALAARLGLSEAALYRHFRSKAQMFEGLLEFIETTIFGLINQIEAGPEQPQQKARSIISLLLSFAEKNPGMTRVLTGEALVFEQDKLQKRVNQMIDRVEASLRQQAKLIEFARATAAGHEAVAASPNNALANASASLAISFVMGRWHRYAKSGFVSKPSEGSAEILPRLF